MTVVDAATKELHEELLAHAEEMVEAIGRNEPIVLFADPLDVIARFALEISHLAALLDAELAFSGRLRDYLGLEGAAAARAGQ